MIVLPGACIGANAAVDTGAVVTTALPANVLAVGDPARPVRELA